MYYEHTAPLFKDLSILNIKDVTDLEMAKFMFKLNNNELPIEISRLLVRCNEIHNYQTRHNVDPVHIKPEFASLCSSFLVQGPIKWKKIDKCLKEAKNVKNFALKIKKSMIENY